MRDNFEFKYNDMELSVRKSFYQKMEKSYDDITYKFSNKKYPTYDVELYKIYKCETKEELINQLRCDLESLNKLLEKYEKNMDEREE